MFRPIIHALVALTVLPALASAESFRPSPLVPSAGIDALNRSVTQQNLGRDLFGSPYASVVIGNVDVYDRFPYVEARYFQVVSDPAWDRLVYGEIDRGVSAFDGAQSGAGALDGPRGLAVDADGRIFVADSGNHRVLVLSTRSEFDRLEMSVDFVIDGLANPHDVAVSDRGTPLDTSDDVLYVANTGANQVVSYALSRDHASINNAIGTLGSGDEHFGGPIAITVGHDANGHTNRIFVADAHNQRLVRLVDRGGQLEWDGALGHDLGTITSLDSDHWGNVYAAAPARGVVQKLTPQLLPVAELASERPRSFHIPFVNVTDHTAGTTTRAGHGGGVVVEEWSDQTGLRLLDLGVEVRDLAVESRDGVTASFTLTDRADVVAEILLDGAVVARHPAGQLDAGAATVTFTAGDFTRPAGDGEYDVRITAQSTYDAAEAAQSRTSFDLRGAGLAQPRTTTLYGASPNPFNPSTSVTFFVPRSVAQHTLTVYDLRGRAVRELSTGALSSGLHAATWDGRDESGRGVASGVYMARLDADGESQSSKLVLVK